MTSSRSIVIFPDGGQSEGFVRVNIETITVL